MAALVFALLTAAAMVLLNLPYTYAELQGEWRSQTLLEFGWTGRIAERQPVQAGFPYAYYTAFKSHEDITAGTWSTTALLLNLAVASALVLLVYALTCLRYRWGLRPGSRWRNPVMLDITVSIAVATLLVGTTCRLYQKTEEHRQLANDASRYGNCYLGCWVPAVVEPRMSRLWTHLLSRLRIARLMQPPPSVLDRLTELDSLTKLQIFGGNVERDHLAMLCKNRRLQVLHLNRMMLDEAELDCIAQLNGLEELSLAWTNVDGSMLKKLDPLRNLKVVHLVGTPLWLKDLGRPTWRDSVQHLYLPRHSSRQGEQIRLDQWDRLTSLSISDSSLTPSPHAIRVELRNLPSLRAVKIDRVQKYELIASHLPRLESIGDDFDLLTTLGLPLKGIPVKPWISRIEIADVPSLQQLNCSADCLESVRISHAPSLQELVIVAGSIESSARSPALPFTVSSLQTIVDSFTSGHTPASLSFERIDFTGIDLTRLGQCSDIRTLSFRDSAVSFEQLRQLRDLDGLRRLDAERCHADAEQLDWILANFADLEVLNLDVSHIDELALTGQSALTMFRTRPLKQVRRICLKELPYLDTQLHIDCPVTEICVDDAPGLSGLGVAAPWPADATLSGVRDLRWFAAGGSDVSDSVLEALLYCGSLDRLMLAYPSISQEMLCRIGGLHELTSLVLPGAAVDDRVTSHYRSLKMLREANFDDTEVGGRTLDWLAEIESLRRLALNRVPLGPGELEKLARFSQLNELELAGVAVSDELLNSLLTELALEHLNFADRELSQAQFECLLRNRSLRLVNLSNCGLSFEQSRRLLEANPRLLVYLGEGAIAERLIAESESGERCRVIDSSRYRWLRLSLANYSIPHDSSLRIDDALVGAPADPSLFGWFTADSFRD